MAKDVEQSLTIVDCPPGEAPDLTAPLTYVSSDEPGIARRRAGKGFVYLGPDQRRITDAETIGRIRRLAIPPAWRNVWICARPEGHLQAVGFDARGRRQYRYHPEFRQMREGAKFEHLVTFAEALPSIRERVAVDMSAHGLGREKMLATVVHLLETTMIRVGNRAYERENHSYGLTTLQGDHVQVEGTALRFQFTGKSGKVWRLDVRDRRVARIVRACQHLPGQTLFGYVDDAGRQQAVTSCDVNAYLKQVSGRDITAKDFRTWAATVMAAKALAEAGPAESLTRAAKAVREVVKEVAVRLGNTPTVCRASYIHPQVIDAYQNGELTLDLLPTAGAEGASPHGLRLEERAVLDFLRRGQGGLSGRVAVESRIGDHPKNDMPPGDKSTYTGDQERKADHIAEFHEERGGQGPASRNAANRSASARKAAAARNRSAEHACQD
jgi:DNA topoisomerase-1